MILLKKVWWKTEIWKIESAKYVYFQVEAYWCFDNYMSMDHVQEDFLEGGMLAKLS